MESLVCGSNVLTITADDTLMGYIKSRADVFLKGDSDIAVACLRYPSLDVIASGPSETSEAYTERLHKYPFLSYAAQFWGHHLRLGGEPFSVQDLVLDFLRKEDRVALAYRALKRSEDWRNRYVRWPDTVKCGVHLAAIFGLHKMIERLRDEGEDLGKRDRNGQTPLSWAIACLHPAVAKVLLDSTDTREQTSSGLSWAAENGNHDLVSLLLRYGPDIEYHDGSGRTPLSLAAQAGNTMVVDLLIDHGARCESRDEEGLTPLAWAAIEGHLEIVEVLLGKDIALVDSQDDTGRTPLMLAAAGGHVAVVRFLLGRDDIDADSKDEKLRPPLMWAAANGHYEVVKMLIESGRVQVDAQDTYSLAAIPWAASGGHWDVVALLRQHMPPIGGESSQEYTVRRA